MTPIGRSSVKASSHCSKIKRKFKKGEKVFPYDIKALKVTPFSEVRPDDGEKFWQDVCQGLVYSLLWTPGYFDETGKEVDHIGPALLGTDQRRKLTEFHQGSSETTGRSVLLYLLVKLNLNRQSNKLKG